MKEIRGIDDEHKGHTDRYTERHEQKTTKETELEISVNAKQPRHRALKFYLIKWL